MSEQQTDAEVITAEDAAEYDRRLNRLRELMDEHDFDAVVANELGANSRQPPYVRFLSHFRTDATLPAIAAVPVIAVVPRSGEPTLLVAPGFEGTYVQLARRQSWIRNV